MMWQVFIHSMDDMLIVDSLPQHLWTRRIAKIFFNSKQTYTTEGARQLTIKQRKCVFPDEISLLTDSNYTFSACMIQCRMDISRKLCGCVSWFYKSIGKCNLTYFLNSSNFTDLQSDCRPHQESTATDYSNL